MEMEKKIDKLMEDVARIKGYLESDQTTNTKGLVERVHDSEERLSEMEIWRTVVKNKVATIAGFISVAASIIFLIIKEIFSKKM